MKSFNQFQEDLSDRQQDFEQRQKDRATNSGSSTRGVEGTHVQSARERYKLRKKGAKFQGSMQTSEPDEEKK